MSDATGHIELERNIDGIVVGVRHRKDLGDIDSLMRSIEEVGLLQPITITPDGVLVCGRRRLEAVRRLGWHTLKVWVRSRISDELSHVLAQQAENTERKPLTQLEAAAMFREVKLLMEEDSERRQRASQFGATSSTGEGNGAGHCPAPRGEGDTRNQAAQFVTGTQSYHRLEKIGWLEDVKNDETRPATVRSLAREALEHIEQGAAVDPAYKRVRAADRLASAPGFQDPEPDPDLARRAEEALERARAEDRKKRAARRKRVTRSQSKPVRAFVLTWGELVGWSEGYDVDEVAAKLSDEEWNGFESAVAETIAFAERLRAARQHLAESA
ncbi:MAG: ParB N-terminal domain-containing protein [Nocardioides sp.]